ncbi:MAG: ATPase [Hominisplanchenecus sp.]|nr:ATPase [Hominisplanchenecus sp.]
MSSRIEQIIEEIEEYVDSCKFQPLSSTKIVVNKEELEELLRELRMKTPDEIKRYQKIISNKDAILADAQSKADAIIADAKAQAQQMVTESEVMQQSYAQSNELLESTNQQAQEIMDSATNDANNIRMGALQYTDEMLANLENIMSHTIETAGEKYNTFLNSIQSCYDIVNKNRRELSPAGSQSTYAAAEDSDAYDDSDEA